MLAECGVFNMLLSDSRCLYCFCSTNLVWLTRRAPFQAATRDDHRKLLQGDHPHDIVRWCERALTEKWV